VEETKGMGSGMGIYYVVSLFPVLGIVQVGDQAAADRYTYLSSLGPFLLIGLVLVFFTEKITQKSGLFIKRAIVLFSFAGILLFLIFSTMHQIPIWKDPFSLWNAEIGLFPDFYRAYKKRGQAYSDRGNHEQAIKDYDRSIQLYPYYAATYLDRGVSYSGIDEYERAIEDFTTAIMIYHEYPEALTNRGIAYLMLGNFQSAIRDFNKVLDLDPVDRNASFQRYLAYKLAIKEYGSAVRTDPGNFEAYINRGGSYAMIGQFNKALEDFTDAINLRPRLSIAYYNRALVYQKMGDEGRAAKDFQEAARLGDKKAQGYLQSRGIQW
jgi:tetratricopeptide (TPR) repeat protein